MNEETGDALRKRLNAETARISWKELAPHFARGALVRVNPGLDLIDVAVAFAEDRRETVAAWLKADEIAVATDADNARWSEAAPEFWAVVVAPWVLVQVVPESIG